MKLKDSRENKVKFSSIEVIILTLNQVIENCVDFTKVP